jgi:hypothetical protein
MNCAKHKPYIALGKHVYTIQLIELITPYDGSSGLVEELGSKLGLLEIIAGCMILNINRCYVQILFFSR